MSWDVIEGSWKELRGAVREQWGKLTDDDVDQIAGRRDRLVGTLQRKYGRARHEIEAEVALFEKQLHDAFARSSDGAAGGVSPYQREDGGVIQ